MANVTGNPTEAQLGQGHLACYNTHQDVEGMRSRSKHLTSIAREPHYPVGNPFEFFACYIFLSQDTTLLDTSPETADGGAAAAFDVGGPDGGDSGDVV